MLLFVKIFVRKLASVQLASVIIYFTVSSFRSCCVKPAWPGHHVLIMLLSSTEVYILLLLCPGCNTIKPRRITHYMYQSPVQKFVFLHQVIFSRIVQLTLIRSVTIRTLPNIDRQSQFSFLCRIVKLFNSA